MATVSKLLAGKPGSRALMSICAGSGMAGHDDSGVRVAVRLRPPGSRYTRSLRSRATRSP
ncbi:hypothetical protein [Gordonia sp. (in: high G+C Gram-positive bacteria)]|uniref:hypothetical protein n=1 Tax=Gordonia sp. (in: high G+C Gram-positive bacteria) TaxID=84139 RepID=UPI003C72EECC